MYVSAKKQSFCHKTIEMGEVTVFILYIGRTRTSYDGKSNSLNKFILSSSPILIVLLMDHIGPTRFFFKRKKT